MGVEHYVACEQCKEYIDLHKAYSFNQVARAERPPVGVLCKETGFTDCVLDGGYWESRGLWFLYRHRGHQGIGLHYDVNDEWWDLERGLTEVFRHEADLKIRIRVKEEKANE